MPPVYFVYLANLYLVGGMTLEDLIWGGVRILCFKRQFGIPYESGECVFYFREKKCTEEKAELEVPGARLQFKLCP